MGGLSGWAAETEANARLISAAPDLLEALNSVLGVLDDPQFQTLWRRCSGLLAQYSGPHFDVEPIRAAIAKATADGAHAPSPDASNKPGMNP